MVFKDMSEYITVHSDGSCNNCVFYSSKGECLAPSEAPNCNNIIFVEKPVYNILDFKNAQDKFNNISGQSSKVSLEDIKNQVNLIKEELLELDIEVQAENEEYILAEAIDVLYTTLGLLQKLENKGMKVHKAMEIIANANLSKFPVCPTDLKDSIDSFKEKGIEVISSYNEDYDVFVIKDTNSKVRKPISFIKADISGCV